MKNTIIAIIIPLLFLSCKDFPEEKRAGSTCAAQFFDGMLVSTGLDSLIVVRDIHNDTIFTTRSETTHCTQPILEEGTLLYALISDELFQCIDIGKKQVRWSYKPQEVTYNFKLLDGFVILSVRSFGVIVLDAKTGAVKYQLKDDDYSECNLPSGSQDFFVKDEKLYVARSRCSHVKCFDLNDGREVWKYNPEKGGSAQIIGINEEVFCGIHDYPKEGLISLLNAETGEVKFQMSEKFDLATSPIIFKNKIIYYTYDGKIKEFDPATLESGILIDLSKSEHTCWSDLHLIGNVVYFIDHDFNLYSFNLENLQLKELGKAQRYLRAAREVNGKVEFVY